MSAPPPPPPRPQVDELPFVVPTDDDEVESTFAPSEDDQSPAAMTFVVDVASPLVNDDAFENSNERSSRPVAPFHVGRSSAYATATLLLSPPAPQTIDETHTFLRSSSWQQAERVSDDDVEPYVHIYDHEQRTFLFVRRQAVEVPLPPGAENDYAWSSMRQDDNRIHSNLVQMLPSRYEYHFYNTIPEHWCRDFSRLGGAGSLSNIYTTSTRRDRRRRETAAAAHSGSDEDSDDVDGTAQTVTPPGSATTATGGVVYRTASVMFRPSNNECAVRVCLPWYDNLDDIDEVLKFGRRHDEDERNGEQSCWTRVDEGDTDGSAASPHTGTPMVALGSILRRPKCLSCGWHEAGLRGGAKSGTATLLTRRDWPLASSIASRHRASCGGDHTSSQMALSIHGAAFDMFDYERPGTATAFFGGGGGWAGGLLDDTMLRLSYSPAASPSSFTTTRQSVRVSCQQCPIDTGRGHSNAMALQDMSSLHPPCGGLSASIIPCIDIWFVICFSFLPRTDFPSVRLVCRQLDVLLCSNCRFWVDRIPMVDSFFVADGGPTDSSCLVFAARRRTIAEHRNAGRWFTPLSTVPISARCMSGCCHNLWKHRSRMQHQVCAAAVLEETDVAEAVSVIRAILFPSTSSGGGLTNAVMASYPELNQNGGTATENAFTARAFILNMRFARSDLLPTVTSNDPSQLFHSSSHTMCVAAFTTGLVLLVSSLEIVLVVLVKSPGATSSGGDGTPSSVTTAATSGTHSSVSSSSSPLMLLPLWILFVLVYPLCYRFFLGSAPRVVLMAMLQVAAVEGSVLLIYFQVTQQPLSPAPVGSSTSEGSLGGALQTSVVLRIVPVFISVTCIVMAHIAQVFQAWECRTGLSTKFPALWSSADNVPGPSVYAVVRWTVQTVLVFSIIGLVVLLMFEINDLVLLSQPTASSSVTLSPSSRGSPATTTPPSAPHVLWFGLPLFSASISAAALIVQAVHRVGFRLLLVECSAILVVCAGYVVALGALAAVGLVMFYVGVEGASVGLLLSVTALFGVTSCVNSLASSCGRASSFAPR